MSLFFKLHISAINVAFVNYQAKENLPEQRGQAAKVTLNSQPCRIIGHVML